MPSNRRLVMEIPELLASIAFKLDTKERGKLMLVSKHFFHIVGPIIWNSVPRLDIVMGLIKDARIEFHSTWCFPGHEPRIYEITTTLPFNPDLSRYDIYAHWVRELEVFGKGNQTIVNLHPFLTLLDGRPPLPNLQHLTAYSTLPIDGKKMLDFIDMFMSPSLTEIRTILHEKDDNGILQTSCSRIPSPSVPKLLSKIKEICPRIRVLEFYPDLRHLDNISEQYKPIDHFPSTLSYLLNLRSFSSTTCILEPATLAILGKLPHLESLGIRGSPIEPSILDKQLSIPTTWFPALKDLRLYDVHHEDIQVLCNQPAIVKKLVSLLIQTDHLTPRNPPDDMLHGQNWIGPFLATLPHLGPHLRDIAFFMGNEADRVEIPRESWGFISRGVISPGDAYSMTLWPNLDEYFD